MSTKQTQANKRQRFHKMLVRIICLVLALSLVATTFFLLIQYLMAL